MDDKFSKKTGRLNLSPVRIKVPGFIKWGLLFSKGTTHFTGTEKLLTS